MDSIKNSLIEISGMNFRQLLTQLIVLGSVASSALMLWKGLMVITNSESPIVVVLTGSMEPSFFRGDLLFINWDYSIGQINQPCLSFKFFDILWKITQFFQIFLK